MQTETHRDSARGVVESIFTTKNGDVLQSWAYDYDARLNPSARRDQRQVQKLRRGAKDGEQFEASILAQIPGGPGARAAALDAEKWLIEQYKALHGWNPEGNRLRTEK